MGKRALFIFTPNQYSVVFDMMKQVAMYLESQLGYEIKCCGVGKDYQNARLEEWDFIFSAQGIEFEFIPGEDSKKHVTWLCDHPHCIVARLIKYADKNTIYVGCVDKKHVSFLQEFYAFPNVGFIPHFGWEARKVIPYNQRSIEVFFPASYMVWEEEVAVRYPGLEGALKVIADKTIEYMLLHDACAMEESMDAVLRSLGEEDTLEVVRECIEFIGEYIDSYWRSYYRKSIVMGLLDADVKLTVCGRNWSRLKEEISKPQNLIILSEEMEYAETVETIANSKLVLNIMPGFKNGSHERVAMATLNEAVCLTDRSLYLEELFEDQNAVVFYERKRPELLADKIKYLLSNPQEAEQIAARGKQVAKRHMTVKNFTDSMLEMLKY